MSTSHVHPASPSHARARPGSRRFGYLVGAAVNAALLYLVNRNPGWQAVPFLTDATTQVLWLVNASFAANLLASLAYVVWDPAWLKALGDVLTTSLGVFATVRIWEVWPLDFAAGSPWEVFARIAVAVAIVGGTIGIVVAVGQFRQRAGGATRPQGLSVSARPSSPDGPRPWRASTRRASDPRWSSSLADECSGRLPSHHW